MVQSNPRPDLPLSARLQQDLKNDLIAGLLVVIPLATTIWLATIVSKFVLAGTGYLPGYEYPKPWSKLIRQFLR